MRGTLCRSTTAIALSALMALAPAATVFGQNQSATPAQPQTPAAAQSPASATKPEPGTSGPPLKIPTGPDYTHPTPWFPHVLVPYFQTDVPQPDLLNTPKIDQLIHDGKLQISMNDAIALAIENNMDISVNRYWAWIAETDILRARGGGGQRGVSFVGTPVAFANVPTLNFDPTLSSTLSWDRRSLPVNNPLTSGTGATTTGSAQSLTTYTALANFGYTQAFHTGTSLTLSFNNTRASSTSAAVLFNPSVTTTATAAFVQPLLNGFGRQINERYIRMALLTKRAVDYEFLQTLISDVVAVQDDYWELVFGRGNVDVQRHAVELAQRLYDDNKKQVQIGTLAPIEIVRAEAQLATAQQQLINAQTVQLQQQSLLMSVITKNPTAPELRAIEIVPTDTTDVPAPLEKIPLADAVNEALNKRPDVATLRLNIQGDDLNVKNTRNALLPTLNLSGFWTDTGLGGDSRITAANTVQGAQLVDAFGNPIPGFFEPAVTTQRPTGAIASAGFGTSASQVFTGKYPEYQAQLSLALPIRNRVAQADSARAQLAQRQDQARLQQLANSVAVDVQNALIVLTQDRAALLAAQKTRELQEQTLDAEQKKLQLGASTIFLVVTDQQALSAAAAAEVRAAVNLSEARVNLERAIGRTLEVNQITVANAKMGITPRDTLIPGTSPGGELLGLEDHKGESESLR